jgi:hypothetical protein
MKNKLLTLAAGLALIAMAGKFFAVPLLAQVRAALVQNVDDPGRIAYQSTAFGTNSEGTCSGNVCVFLWPPVPANHRLVAQHIQAANPLTSLSPAPGFQVFLAGGTSAGTSFYAPSLGVQSIFDQPTLAYYDAGSVPQADVFTSVGALFDPTASARLTLTGYLLDCSAAPCAPIAH